MSSVAAWRRGWLAGVGALLLALVAGAAAAETRSADAAAQLEQGRRIYMEGVLPDGQPLRAERSGRDPVQGAQAACVNCHRRSGMGGVEGELQIPPIGGRFLYAKRADMALAIMDPRFGRRMNQAHPPYDDDSLALAIRAGTAVGGRAMNVAMPHFRLDDNALHALTAYLQTLGAQWSPGVSPDVLRFATVVTPQVDPARRKVVLDMLQAAVTQKNGSTIVGAHRGGRRHMATGAEQILGTERKWELEVWELQGEPASWAAQLDANYRARPVFALLSGLSDGEWAPVHDFCERQRVPCWFPSVDVAVAAPGDVYSLYFQRGVSLEAQVLAQALQAGTLPRPAHLVQVHRDDVRGRAALAALRLSLQGSGIALREEVLSGADGADLPALLERLPAGDSAMLWLAPSDLKALDGQAPPRAGLLLSGALGAGSLPPSDAAWRRAAHLVYPYELPSMRNDNLVTLRSWLRFRQLPVVDEELQSEAYFAISFMTDIVAEMLDNLNRDYLLERAEDMLGKRETGKAEGEVRDRVSLATPEQLARRYPKGRRLDEIGLTVEPGQGPNLLSMRHGTTVYPRLTLGPGQRFASRGAYIVHFGSDGLIADSDWIVP